MSDEVFFRKVNVLKKLGWLALIGVIIAVIGIFTAGTQLPTWAALGIVLVSPAVFYLVLLVTWHWKGRYIGNHSNLWGGLIVIETSGWFKLVYLFRHIIPDARGTGRYNRGSQHAA